MLGGVVQLEHGQVRAQPRLRTKCGLGAWATSGSQYAPPVGMFSPSQGGRESPGADQATQPTTVSPTAAAGIAAVPDLGGGGHAGIAFGAGVAAAGALGATVAVRRRRKPNAGG